MIKYIAVIVTSDITKYDHITQSDYSDYCVVEEYNPFEPKPYETIKILNKWGEKGWKVVGTDLPDECCDEECEDNDTTFYMCKECDI